MITKLMVRVESHGCTIARHARGTPGISEHRGGRTRARSEIQIQPFQVPIYWRYRGTYLF